MNTYQFSLDYILQIHGPGFKLFDIDLYRFTWNPNEKHFALNE